MPPTKPRQRPHRPADTMSRGPSNAVLLDRLSSLQVDFNEKHRQNRDDIHSWRDTAQTHAEKIKLLEMQVHPLCGEPGTDGSGILSAMRGQLSDIQNRLGKIESQTSQASDHDDRLNAVENRTSLIEANTKDYKVTRDKVVIIGGIVVFITGLCTVLAALAGIGTFAMRLMQDRPQVAPTTIQYLPQPQTYQNPAYPTPPKPEK